MKRAFLGVALVGIAWQGNAQEIQSPINGHYYQLLQPAFSANIWADLQAEAEMNGGNLVTIRSAAENQWIVDTFGGMVSGNDIYIGFNDVASENDFVWVSGEPVTYTNWNPGEPNNSGGEDYGEMNVNTGGWNDNEETQFQPGLMERISFEFRINPTGGGFVLEGSTVVLSAEAWGNTGPISYQWRKNGSPLTGETGTSLTLTNVTSADDGTYDVQASDSSKATITSAGTTIIVVAPGSLPIGGIAVSVTLAAGLLIGSFVVIRRKIRA